MNFERTCRSCEKETDNDYMPYCVHCQESLMKICNKDARRYIKGAICEHYVNNPDMPLTEQALALNIGVSTINGALKEYFGTGMRVNLTIQSHDNLN